MSIFARYIHEMTDKSHLLTPEDLAKLRKLLGENDISLTIPDDDDDSAPLELGSILTKLTKTAERLYKLATMSDEADDLKVAAATLKQAMDVAIKHADKIRASDRALKIENALVDAVDAVEERHPGFKKVFLAHLKEQLGA